MFLTTKDSILIKKRNHLIEQAYKNTIKHFNTDYHGYYVMNSLGNQTHKGVHPKTSKYFLYLVKYAQEHRMYRDGTYRNWAISHNSFKKTKMKKVRGKLQPVVSRIQDNTKYISCFVADLDVVKFGLKLSDFDEYGIWRISGLPEPTEINCSGHGFHFIWWLTRSYYVNSKKFLHMYKSIEKQIVKRLRNAIYILKGSDKYKEIVDSSVKDVTRLFRVDFTINSKSNQMPKLAEPLFIGKLAKLSDFKKLLPYSKEQVIKYRQKAFDKFMANRERWQKQNKINHQRRLQRAKRYCKKHHIKFSMKTFNSYKCSKTKKVENRYQVINPKHHKYDIYSLNFNRVLDLIDLAKMYHYNLPERDKILFLLAVHLLKIENAKSTWKDVKRLNKRLKLIGHHPYEKNGMHWLKYEIIDKTKRMKKYKYRNSTIISYLGITGNQQRKLRTIKVHYLNSTGFKHHKNHLKCVKARKLRDKTIVKLFQKERNKTHVAKKLKISRATVIQVIKKYHQTSNSSKSKKNGK